MAVASISSAPGVRTSNGHRPGGLPVDVLESKLYTPSVRPGVVPRPDLMHRQKSARGLPTVAVVAPAGYGKTTLLALWTEADDRPFAWVSLDPHDNDPIVLLTHLAVAIDRISPLPSVLDDVHHLEAGPSLDGLAFTEDGARSGLRPRDRPGTNLGHDEGPAARIQPHRLMSATPGSTRLTTFRKGPRASASCRFAGGPS